MALNHFTELDKPLKIPIRFTRFGMIFCGNIEATEISVAPARHLISNCTRFFFNESRDVMSYAYLKGHCATMVFSVFSHPHYLFDGYYSEHPWTERSGATYTIAWKPVLLLTVDCVMAELHARAGPPNSPLPLPCTGRPFTGGLCYLFACPCVPSGHDIISGNKDRVFGKLR